MIGSLIIDLEFLSIWIAIKNKRYNHNGYNKHYRWECLFYDKDNNHFEIINSVRLSGLKDEKEYKLL